VNEPDASIDRTLNEARRRLRRVAAASARLDAEWLLGRILDRDRAWLIAHGDEPLGAGARAAFAISVERRAAGEPVAYILGDVGFFGYTFLVTPEVLVPRPESEHVVEAAIADLRSRLARTPAPRACDIGTGSGALGISLALAVPAAVVTVTDASATALAVAARNAERLGVTGRVRVREGDLLDAVAGEGPIDVIVANLPYIPTRAIPQRPDPVGYEPAIALDGGPDGLVLYGRLLDQLIVAAGCGTIRLAADGGGRATACFFEAAPGTIEPLAALVERAFPQAYVEIGEDYAGIERFVAVTLA